MAKSPDRTQSKAAQLIDLAGTVHTYESFGRAIVAAALKQAAANVSSEGVAKASATVEVRPIASTTFSAGSKAAGAHEKAETVPAISILICFGSDCHVFST